jgi:hypothetical protein
LKLPSNTREILDSGNPQQIPLGFSLFNGNDKTFFLLGYFLVWATIEREPKVTKMAPCKLA